MTEKPLNLGLNMIWVLLLNDCFSLISANSAALR